MLREQLMMIVRGGTCVPVAEDNAGHRLRSSAGSIEDIRAEPSTTAALPSRSNGLPRQQVRTMHRNASRSKQARSVALACGNPAVNATRPRA
jgi:hypothetical protein